MGSRKKVALTFDDGYEDIYTIVYSNCRKRKNPFVVFVTCSFLDRPGYLTRKQLVELAQDPLVTIGSHNMNHVPLKKCTREEQKMEMLESKRLLEELLGKPVEYLAYPYGQNNKETREILKKSKAYTYAFVSGGILCNCITNRFRYQMRRLYMADSTFDEALAHLERYK